MLKDLLPVSSRSRYQVAPSCRGYNDLVETSDVPPSLEEGLVAYCLVSENYSVCKYGYTLCLCLLWNFTGKKLILLINWCASCKVMYCGYNCMFTSAVLCLESSVFQCFLVGVQGVGGNRCIWLVASPTRLGLHLFQTNIGIIQAISVEIA